MKDNKKGNKVIKTAMFGGLLGGAIGLLLAPKSGQELRQDIAMTANKVGDKAIEIRDKAQNTWQNVENKTQVTINTGKSWIEKGKIVASNLKAMVSEIRQGALTKTCSIDALEETDSGDPIIEDETDRYDLIIEDEPQLDS